MHIKYYMNVYNTIYNNTSWPETLIQMQLWKWHEKRDSSEQLQNSIPGTIPKEWPRLSSNVISSEPRIFSKRTLTGQTASSSRNACQAHRYGREMDFSNEFESIYHKEHKRLPQKADIGFGTLNAIMKASNRATIIRIPWYSGNCNNRCKYQDPRCK